jgi:hypothetical protein
MLSEREKEHSELLLEKENAPPEGGAAR